MSRLHVCEAVFLSERESHHVRRNEPDARVQSRCQVRFHFLHGHLRRGGKLLRKPTERQISAMKLRETSMCGKANTLLIANTQGFHRMGEFSDERPREKIYICFREVESAQNRRGPKAR